jgi:hypothetical protein
MKTLVLGLAALALSSTATAATTSSDLLTLAKQLEANPASSAALNKQLLTLLREPAKTLEGRTLPTTAANYTGTVETALKLAPDPTQWFPEVRFLPSSVYKVSCAATISFWDPTSTAGAPGLRFEANAFGVGNCPSIMSASVAKAWAWRLQQIGR